MRVMQVMAGAAEGGAETFFVTLVSALAKTGLEQRAVIRRNPARAELLHAAGLAPVELPFRRWFDLRTQWGLKQEIAGFRPDIVMTWMSRASNVTPSGNYLRLARLGNYYDLKYFRGCDHLLCIAPKIADYCAEQGWPRDTVHYMPNFALVEPRPPVDRAALGTPDDVPLLLALSRLHPAKGLDVLLKALAIETRAHLWIAGEGPNRAELEQLARDLGVDDRVRFLGWRRDRGALMAACDICVFPSRYEPFGTVSLEAWGYERPLVAAASDGPAGLVRDEVDALLVPIEESEPLAAAIRRLIDDPGLGRSLVQAGAARYAAEFTEAACVKRYLDLFEALLARSRAGVAAVA